MSISYTTNFRFPLLDDGASNWGAVINGVLQDIDKELSKELVFFEGEVVQFENEEVKYG